MKRSSISFFSIIFLSLLFPTLAEAAQKAVAPHPYGFWSVLPALVAILLAFIFKNVVLSLVVGAFSGVLFISLQSDNIVGSLLQAVLGFMTRIQSALASFGNSGIVLQCLAIGGMIALITRSGGAKAVAEKLANRVRSDVSAQLSTWALGLIIFFDDYANALIIGPVMRPIADKLRISREKLAFIVDATAAPVAGMALISTWVAYELGLISAVCETIGLQANAYSIFLETIPYRFYNIVIMAFIVFSALMRREFGPMLTAQRRALKTGAVMREGAKLMVQEKELLDPATGLGGGMRMMIVPISVLLFAALFGFYYNGYYKLVSLPGAFLGNGAALLPNLFYISSSSATQAVLDAPFSGEALRFCFGASSASVVLFQAALVAGFVVMLLAAQKKIMRIKEGFAVWLKGVKSLVPTVVILLLAWTLTGVIKELQTASYVVGLLKYSVPAEFVPGLVFLTGAVISFATGTSYGTMAILMPLAVPLAHSLGGASHELLVITIGAVLTGAVFGDHCSPISDTTILSSTGSSCDHMDHVKTQFPYALLAAGVALFVGYLPAGAGVPVIPLLLGSLLLVPLLLRIIGKKVDAE